MVTTRTAQHESAREGAPAITHSSRWPEANSVAFLTSQCSVALSFCNYVPRRWSHPGVSSALRRNELERGVKCRSGSAVDWHGSSYGSVLHSRASTPPPYRKPIMTRPFCSHSPRLVLRVAAALIWIASGSALRAQAATNADTIVLIRKFSGARFATANKEAKVFSGVFGLSSEFESVIGKNPDALHAARQVKPYSVVQLVGSLGMVVAGALALKESLDGANSPLTAKSSTTPLVVMATSGAAVLVGLFGGRHYLSQSVRLFNDGQRTARRGDAASRLGGARVGVGISAMGRTPLAKVGIIVPMP